MSDDPASGDDVPDSVREWLAGLAEERDLSERELFERLVAGGDGTAPDESSVEAAGLERRVDELETDVATLGTDLDELIRDVRERVIQVKREADAKAPHDHAHPELSEAVARVDAHLEALASDYVALDSSVDGLDERIDAVDDRTMRGFENFEDVLEYLIETTDDLQEKLETVAVATLDLRERTARVSRAEARRAAADDIRESANEFGVVEAKCDNCGGSVDLRMLGGPDCPHCDARFVELEPRRGFFRSSRLHTGERPALEGEVAGESSDLASVVDREASAPPSFGVRQSDRRAEPESAPDDLGFLFGGEDESEATVDAADGAATADAIDPGDGSAAVEGPGTIDGPEVASSTPASATDRAIDDVAGVEPADAERLRAAGVDTVAALASADPASLAGETGIDRDHVETMVRRAGTQLDSG